ncbi:hypothetical protein VAR608DRAFT_4397 [Variovorax sp. HW608]|nr:hypothetical protein VAR608DRAFT_4397 [Variovorax sp. HW608]
MALGRKLLIIGREGAATQLGGGSWCAKIVYVLESPALRNSP